MKSNQKLAVALVAGIANGGAVIHGLNAQTTPPVYVVVDISDITNPEGFKAISVEPAGDADSFWWQVRYSTENITALHGIAPKRFVLIAFPSVEEAKAWKASANSKEVEVIRDKTTKSSEFLVGGM